MAKGTGARQRTSRPRERQSPRSCLGQGWAPVPGQAVAVLCSSDSESGSRASTADSSTRCHGRSIDEAGVESTVCAEASRFRTESRLTSSRASPCSEPARATPRAGASCSRPPSDRRNGFSAISILPLERGGTLQAEAMIAHGHRLSRLKSKLQLRRITAPTPTSPR